jgi:hypothetical protein
LSSALYSELCNLQCGARVLEYVTKWRAGTITQLRAAKFVVSFHMVIQRLLDCLPSSVPYDILHFRTIENINNIPVDNVTAFIKLTDDVLKIDNTYRRTTHGRDCPNPTHPTNPVASPLPSSSSTVVTAKVSTQPRSSLVCSNCHLVGHMADKCFKAGGGLEGKRDQYLVSRNHVVAHLAHLTDILDGNPINELDSDLLLIPPDMSTPDVIMESKVKPS